MRHPLLHALPLLLLATLISPSTAGARPHPAGLTREEIVVDGRSRSFFLHLPPQHREAASLPVLLALHGGGRADGDEMAAHSGYNAIADREGFIVVYPNGIDAQWNDGRGKAFRRSEGHADVDDVGFLSSLIDHLIAVYQGDPARVYVTGVSNGGMMTLRLGCEIASRLAAIAPVIASTPRDTAARCTPDAPLPLLLMNGTEDPLIPWAGGPVVNPGKSYGEVESTRATVRFWVKHNRCRLPPARERLPDQDPTDGSTVTVTTYQEPARGCDVVLYTIEGGGHNFPGSQTPDLPLLLGRKNRDIDGPEIIWAFFKQHRR